MDSEEHRDDREIIALVRSNPLLWQKHIKMNKKDRDTINQAFSQIGSLLSKPLTGEQVSTRWKSIRDQYSKEIRKVIASQPRSGAGSEELSYKPMWPLFSELSFLKDVIKPRKTQSNVSRKKLKLNENNSPVNIVIPSSILHISKNIETMWIDKQVTEENQIAEESQENQVTEESQIIEEQQIDEESQMTKESQIEVESQIEGIEFDDVNSVYSSSIL